MNWASIRSSPDPARLKSNHETDVFVYDAEASGHKLSVQIADLAGSPLPARHTRAHGPIRSARSARRARKSSTCTGPPSAPVSSWRSVRLHSAGKRRSRNASTAVGVDGIAFIR